MFSKAFQTLRKRPRHVLGLLLAGAFGCFVFLVVSILTWLIFFHGGDSIASYLFRHRHPPTDLEYAPTIVSYVSGPDIAAVIGGNGQGLDCSIPWPLGPIMFRRGPRSSEPPVELQFRQACVFHDMCYRHGLATYGYTQADCDALLQEQASRICKEIFKSKGWAQCHAEARKVLLGVSLGGPNSFQGWWTSTFNEFDPNPMRSHEFRVSRLVSGSSGPNPVIDDRTQLVTMRVRPSGITLSEPGTNRADATVELRRSFILSAPFLQSQETQDSLYWYLRAAETNTRSILTSASIGDIRTKREKVFDADILTSSPIFLPRPRWSEPIVGLTIQNGPLDLCGYDRTLVQAPRLRICATVGPIYDPRSKRTYSAGRTKDMPAANAYRFFQSMPVATKGHLVIFKRGTTDGSNYRNAADAFVIELAKLGAANNTADVVTRIVADVPIRERDEPVAALPEDTAAPVLISVTEEEGSGRVSLYEYDLAQPKGERRPSAVTIGGKPVTLSSTWIGRPVLLMKPSASSPEASRLILSRAQFAKLDTGATVDTVNLDVLALAHGDRAWRVEMGAHCKVTYTARQKPDPTGNTPFPPACRLAALDSENRRILETRTAVTQLMAGQLLAGYPARAGGLTLAMPDRCMPSHPLVLDARLDAENPLSTDNLKVRKSEVPGDGFNRMVVCNPVAVDALSEWGVTAEK